MFIRSQLSRFAVVPKPLSIRKDSLLVQCLIAAAIYFVPQDAVALGAGFFLGRAHSRGINNPQNIQEPKKAVEAYLASRGLQVDNVNVRQGSNVWEVKLKSVFNN